ncbi:efflux transporter, RND family, MFP subunit [Oceanicola granulosus HTCC2516]|uniref:Efflux transporter, RND family, MFP subunit n=1 Tax=Oceanicola granulosus (strain ATCC BAA-861 / DSM 15982 / KCTC 12143 / HTCC2516) TaxID=314256 RepID=Q2CB76_OCEGH|nr:HlyD family efflux transporter periplasmic adaptor subunit [Oceanicola granulosus]EAR49909.1 efflux transporter, RND family, MFP subunit [Oceanicola granulosus HTCC2516]
MRFLRRSLVGIFLLSLTFALLVLAGRTVVDAVEARLSAEPRAFPQRERVLAVNVLPYETEAVTPRLEVFGELRSQRTLDLRASVGGTIVAMAEEFAEGGHVAAGELLLRIDPVEAEAALARAEADRQDAQAELRDARRALVLAEDELAAAEQQATLREQALARQQDLSTRGVGTAAAVEEAELAVSSARGAVLTNRQGVAQAEARIDLAETTLARTEIGVEEAERRLADTELTAPFDGTLAGVAVLEGGRVTENELVAQLVDPERLEVSFRVSTAQYARLLDAEGRLRGAPVTVSLDVAGVDLTTTGTISRESASVAEGQSGRLLFARLDDAPGFRPGDFVTVSIEEPLLRDVARLPSTALGSDGALLVVGEGERLELVAVELLRRQGDDVLVRGDDLAGALVVSQRSPLLGAGIRVDPIQPGATDVPDEEVARAAAAAPPPTVRLEPDRRARLVAFVTESRMPDEAKTRLLSELEQEDVPTEIVDRLESRMGS